MSDASNNQGRAYEYICLITLNSEINKYRKAVIIDNSAYMAALHAWTLMTPDMQVILHNSALAAVNTIFDLEPLIIEKDDDILELAIQTDDKGKQGDVRDILIIRKDIQWEIGLSIKHNHFAVKHSRLSHVLDFGKSWYGINCSEQYWNSIKPIFTYLDSCKLKGMKWSDIIDKDLNVYVPLLNAFKEEITSQTLLCTDIPKRMVEYLLGEFDFYKIISIDKKNVTQIQTYNLHDSLNKPSKYVKPSIKVPTVQLPTRIVSFGFKPGSTNTLELYLDGGWQFSFRIHNASTYVESSLKFDVQVIGVPATILSINCSWK